MKVKVNVNGGVGGGAGGGLTKTRADALYHPKTGKEDLDMVVKELYIGSRENNPITHTEDVIEEVGGVPTVVGETTVVDGYLPDLFIYTPPGSTEKYLRTPLPFFSDKSVSAKAPSADSSSGGGGVSWGEDANNGYETLLVEGYDGHQRKVALYQHLHATSDITGLSTALSAKADKVTPYISGHLVSLDASGNLVDSGVTPSGITTDVVLEQGKDSSDNVVPGTLRLKVNNSYGSNVAVPGLGGLAFLNSQDLSGLYLPITGGTITPATGQGYALIAEHDIIIKRYYSASVNENASGALSLRGTVSGSERVFADLKWSSYWGVSLAGFNSSGSEVGRIGIGLSVVTPYSGSPNFTGAPYYCDSDGHYGQRGLAYVLGVQECPNIFKTLTPAAPSTDTLGTGSKQWYEAYAGKFYPNNNSQYITYTQNNRAITTNGDFVATGSITAGGVSFSQPYVLESIIPDYHTSSNPINLGSQNSGYRFDNVYTIDVNAYGKITTAELEVTSETITIPYFYIGYTHNLDQYFSDQQLTYMASGKIRRIIFPDGSTTKTCSIIEVDAIPSGRTDYPTNYTIYFGKYYAYASTFDGEVTFYNSWS